MRFGPLALLGACAGLLSGLLGIGGGLVVGPMLALAGVPLRIATGTALAVVAPVALAGVLTDAALAPEQLHSGLAGLLALGGFCGVLLGRGAARRLAELRLRALFAFLLLAVAARTFGFGGAIPDGPMPGILPAAEWLRSGAAFLLGAVAGGCAILFGVGGGVVVVPGLVFVLGDVTPHGATATSLLAMIPTAAFGAWTAWRDGRVSLRPLRVLLPAAIAGAIAGVALRNHGTDARTLSLLFGAFLTYVAVQLLWRRKSGAEPAPK